MVQSGCAVWWSIQNRGLVVSQLALTEESLTRNTPTKGAGVFFSAIIASTKASSVTTKGAMKPGNNGRRWIGTARRFGGLGAFSPAAATDLPMIRGLLLARQ